MLQSGSAYCRVCGTAVACALLLTGAACSSPAAVAPTTVPAPTPISTANLTPTAGPTTPQAAVPVTLPDFSLCWVAYSPTKYDPTIPRLPLPSDLREDLRVLREAGFEGLITYGAWGNLDQVARLAREAGFAQIILGVASPDNEAEVSAAIAAAPYAEAYIIGNEGLEDGRYTLESLQATLLQVSAATGKPVTTSARIETYYSLPELMALGDWLSPIVHPFWHNYFDPAEAAEWTAVQYADLSAVAPGRPIQFKELGLPTAGAAEVSEPGQAEYYRLLQQTPDAPPFAYFEAFDQAWKATTTGEAVEDHWGLFRADRSPKAVVDLVCGKTPAPMSGVTPGVGATIPPEPPATTVTATEAPTPTATAPATEPAPDTVYLFGDAPAAGYEVNIDTSAHQFGWLDGGSFLQANFPAGQQWAVVYLTVGPAVPAGQRSASADFSDCDALSVDLWSAQPGVEVKVGVKDVDDPDDGSETLLSRSLTAEPLVYQFPLAKFATADLGQVYVPFELVYQGGDAATVFIDNIRLTCRR